VRELGLALADTGSIEPWFLVNPDLALPKDVEEQFRAAGQVAHSDERSLPRSGVYHVPSPLEPAPLGRVWPRRLRPLPLVVTLHDLIPAIFPRENMPDAGVRRAYWTRLELARHATLVLSVSRATARDAVRLLGLRGERIAVTGGGVSPQFQPPESVEAARAALAERRRSIAGEYVLFTGGMDFRKNVPGLLTAYAGLPGELRERYQLVIVGRLGLDDTPGAAAQHARSLGLADRLVLTGHVDDDELVLLYQAASLFVFPSRYEGFGLPVIEALACGTPAIAGRNSSLVELVTEEDALFDAADPSSIRDALVRVLTDPALLERLRRPNIRHEYTWRRIAEQTVKAYAAAAHSRS
jgi:glycosyltransferase involved in cell wall biosynthesis